LREASFYFIHLPASQLDIDLLRITELYLEQPDNDMGWRNMETKSSKESKTRMVHVRLPEEIHKKVRVRAAETDQTIQDWVLQAIQRELKIFDSKSTVDKTGQ
jgi:hypothetical protein